MTEGYADIARVLGSARRREARIVLAAAGGFGAAGALAAALAGAALLARGAGPPGVVRAAALSLAGLSLAGAVAWAAFALLRRASSPEATARTLGRAEPVLSSDLLSAVELERDHDGLAAAGYSLALADGHIAHTAVRTRAVDLVRALPSTSARRAGLAAGAALIISLVALAVSGRALAAGYARLAGLGPADPVAHLDPITGDVELTYHYPAHTGRPSRTISGTGGEITAPRGTEVRLSARADRPIESAELEIDALGPAPATAAVPGGGMARTTTVALEVKDGRALSGRLMVEEPGTYRFRFRRGRKVLAEGPHTAIALEPDAFPEVRITAPAADVEVDARARPRVDWTASDDYGLSELALVVKPPAGAEVRKVLRRFESGAGGGATRRESGSLELDLATWKLAEGERILYWLEVLDNDAVSGPKRGASATQVVRIYSEAEHRRKLLERAQVLWEQLVRLLGDRLELPDGDRGAAAASAERLARLQALDGRTRALHVEMADAARAMRKDRAAPRTILDALLNVAAGLRASEQLLTSLRTTALRLLPTLPPRDPFWPRMAAQDAALDREMEKDVLYLEQLFDKERAQDLVRLARELQSRRRDLASLLERYRLSPGEDARRELTAEIGRMKQRMQEMARRMAELAKGIHDEHMNQEALAEMSRQQDALGGLDEVEKRLAAGDIEGAMKALDALGSQMQRMLAGLERTAGEPDTQNRELMKEMRAFQQQLATVQKDQEQVAGETEQVRKEYRKKLAEQLKKMEQQAGKLEKLARQASAELQKARDGLSPRAEEEFGRARESLQDLEKALGARDFDAALETVRKSVPSLQRLALGLGDDAQLAERFGNAPGQKGPMMLREAERHAREAMPPARQVKEELEKLFPDPRSVLSQGDQQKLDKLSRRQGDLERQAGQLRQKLQQLAEKAPVFPPQTQAMLGEAQGHMGQAAGELGHRNPQRGHGQQKQALDALERFQKGLEEMARKGAGSKGEGFPFPFAMAGGEGQEGMDGEVSSEKVEIPGADAYKVPEEFRKDILEAMKQGAPEPYRPELQRYYEELVK